MSNKKTLVKIFLLFIGMISILSIAFQGQTIASQNYSFRNSINLFNSSSASAQGPEITLRTYLPLNFNNYPTDNVFSVEVVRYLSTNETLKTRLKDLDPGYVRYHRKISWRELQPNEGDPIDWPKLQTFEADLRLLKDAGIKPLVTIHDSPRWATQFPTSCSAIKSDKFWAFGNFMSQIVNHFKTPEFNVHNWELGNEPDVAHEFVPVDAQWGCWGDIDDPYYGGRHYGNMLKIVAPYIRNQDPLARIWMGGLLLNSPDTTDPNRGKPELFLKGILEAGAAPYFDVVAFHGHLLYWGQYRDSDTVLSGPWMPLGGGLRGKARFLRDIMSDYNVDKPLVLNETGIGCRAGESYCEPTPDQVFWFYQADMAPRMGFRVIDENINGYHWYSLGEPGWNFTGLLDGSYNPKPVYESYRYFISRVKNSAHIGPVDYGPDIEAYAFKSGASNLTHALWAIENQAVNVIVPKSKYVEARDIFGDLIQPTSDGSNYRLSVGYSPIYLDLLP